MTPAQAKRTAFLITALDDIRAEIDPPQAERQSLAKESPPPLGLTTYPTVKLIFEDGSECLRTIATIDADVLFDALTFVVERIRAELKALGIEVE
jgi:hypothetical protein